MNDSFGTKTTDIYQQELHDSLARLEACMPPFEGFPYFLQIVREQLSL